MLFSFSKRNLIIVTTLLFSFMSISTNGEMVTAVIGTIGFLKALNGEYYRPLNIFLFRRPFKLLIFKNLKQYLIKICLIIDVFVLIF